MVAVKRFYATENVVSEFLQEVTILSQIRHPHVLQLLGVCREPLCMVTEFMRRGSLLSILHNKSIKLPWHRRLKFAVHSSKGMLCLHGAGLVHRDLKSLNIFVADDWTCKIG